MRQESVRDCDKNASCLGIGVITFFPAIFPFKQKGIQAKEEKETF